MKRTTTLLILTIAALVILAGCAQVKKDNNTQEPKLGASCGTVTPGQNDACCAQRNADTSHVDCVGEWKYVGGDKDCAFVCETENTSQMNAIDSNANSASIKPQDFCQSDDDCACGVSLETADCYIGNREYIDNGTIEYANDGGICKTYCDGQIGNLELKCVSNRCVAQ